MCIEDLPLVQRAQQAYGSDRLGMLMVSVDRSYTSSSAMTYARVDKVFKAGGFNWPCVFDAKGWDGVMRTFNLGSYGLVLVDGEGIVRRIGLSGHELDKALAEVLGDPAQGAPQPASTH